MSGLDLIIAAWPALPDGSTAELDHQADQTLKERVLSLPRSKFVAVAEEYTAMIGGIEDADATISELGRRLVVGVFEAVATTKEGGFQLNSLAPMASPPCPISIQPLAPSVAPGFCLTGSAAAGPPAQPGGSAGWIFPGHLRIWIWRLQVRGQVRRPHGAEVMRAGGAALNAGYIS